jgi:RNA polymerase sigma-70 factor (ECF subfamily)
VTATQLIRDQSVPRTDDVLLRAIAEGDLGSLGELYDRHARSMLRAVERTLGAATDAGDIVHTVFLKLPTIARAYDGRLDARAWLVGISVRLALRHRRGLGRFLRMLSRLSQTEGDRTATNPEVLAGDRQDLRRFQAAFQRLSPKKRAVFNLVEMEGLSTDEASRALGVPPSTIRTRLHHARLELNGAVLRWREP